LWCPDNGPFYQAPQLRCHPPGRCQKYNRGPQPDQSPRKVHGQGFLSLLQQNPQIGLKGVFIHVSTRVLVQLDYDKSGILTIVEVWNRFEDSAVYIQRPRLTDLPRRVPTREQVYFRVDEDARTNGIAQNAAEGVWRKHSAGRRFNFGIGAGPPSGAFSGFADPWKAVGTSNEMGVPSVLADGPR
jgi:hypothetical protein